MVTSRIVNLMGVVFPEENNPLRVNNSDVYNP
jgi:hypothetical protein